MVLLDDDDICIVHSASSLQRYMSSSFFVQLRWEVIVRFVDIGGMDDHHCLSFLFIIYPQIDISRQSHTFPLRCSHKNYVRFVFISSWLLEGSCLIYVIYVWFGIVVCNTYCDFVLFVFVLCTLCCQFLWIVHFWLLLRYSLTFICFVCLRLVYTMLPVSLDCPFLIAPSVFSNIYLFCFSSSCVPYVASFSGLSICVCILSNHVHILNEET